MSTTASPKKKVVTTKTTVKKTTPSSSVKSTVKVNVTVVNPTSKITTTGNQKTIEKKTVITEQKESAPVNEVSVPNISISFLSAWKKYSQNRSLILLRIPESYESPIHPI